MNGGGYGTPTRSTAYLQGLNDATIMRLQALQDLEANMNRLQGVIEQKEEMIAGL